jgi:hypothetical protein
MSHDTSLLNCLRWDADGDRRLQALDAEQWLQLWARLEAREGQPFLARRLQQTGVRPPPDIAVALRGWVQGQAARNLLGRKTALDAIRDVGRPAMLLKGIDLASRIYGNLGLRAMGDMDILVRKEDFPLYNEYFSDRALSCTPPFQAGLLESKDHHHILVRLRDRRILPTELHWRLTKSDDHQLDLDNIWERSLPGDAHDSNVRVMSPNDLLPYLCLHMGHHTFGVPLTQLWDLAELLACPSLQLDWPTVWSRAKEWQATACLELGLHLLSRTLGVDTSRLCAWRPEGPLAASLPDLLSNLGLYPSMDRLAGKNFSLLLSTSSSGPERLNALRKILLPSRADLYAKLNRKAGNPALDSFLYLLYWKNLLSTKAGLVIRRMIRNDPLRQHSERLAIVQRYLTQKR